MARSASPIVVGFSSMSSSQHAVRWAAAEAERRGCGLLIVHAQALPQVGQPVQHDVDAMLHNEAAGLLERVAVMTRREHPQLEISTRLVLDAPVNALRDASVKATLTVLGTKESGRVTTAILGSVASALAAVNPAPVAVVHPDHPVDSAGPVVVGIHRSAENVGAIEFALAEGVARKSEVIAVHAWNASVVTGGVPDYPAALAQTALEQEATTRLSQILARWADKYPDAVVTGAVRHGRPSTVLLEYSRTASMVVVGRRPRDEFTALVMGSTSRALTPHSECPVVIVHDPDTDS